MSGPNRLVIFGDSLSDVGLGGAAGNDRYYNGRCGLRLAPLGMHESTKKIILLVEKDGWFGVHLRACASN